MRLPGGGSVVNNGTIQGGLGGGMFGASLGEGAGTGSGGASGHAYVWRRGNGGAGIVGANLTVVNSGLIAGGACFEPCNPSVPSHGNAINFTGGTNSLELRDGFSFVGNVVGNGDNDTLSLGGDADSNFDVGAIGPIGGSGQYQGFETFEKTGDSTWTLTGTTGAVTPWTLSDGTLSVSSDGNLGDPAGALTFDGGRLRVTGTDFTTTNRSIIWGDDGGTFDIADPGNTFSLSQDWSNPTGGFGKAGSGTLKLTGSVETGLFDFAQGTVEVTGDGTLDQPASVSGAGGNAIGRRNGDDAELLISDGGTVSTEKWIDVGYGTGATGRVTVTGEGSSLHVSSHMTLGTNGTGTLTVNDTGNVTGASALYVGGGSSGNLGSGAVTVRGRESRVEAGYVQIADYGNGATGAVTLGEGGALSVSHYVSMAFNNPDGSATLKIGAASGDPTEAVAPGVLDASELRFREDSAHLNFNHTGNAYTFDTPLVSMTDGVGFVNHYAGTTLLTGDSSGFSGDTIIHGGTLAVNGTLGGSVDVTDGATLGGTGTVGNTTIAGGGRLAPGNSTGTLTVAGDLAFQAGSFFDVEVDEANGVADRVDVGGIATLAGTVSVNAYQADLDYGSTYTILTAGSLVDGFDAVEANYAFLDPALAYDRQANEVTLSLERKTDPGDPSDPDDPGDPDDPDDPVHFRDAARTPNQVAAADGAESLGEGNTLFDAIIVLPEGSPPAAFDAISGEIHASARTALIENSRFVRNAVNARIRAAFSKGTTPAMPVMAFGPGGPGPTAPESIGPVAWGEIYGAWSETDGDGNAAKLDRASGGFVTGIDGAITRNIRLGLVAGYGHSAFDVDERAASGSSDNVHLGLYGGGQWDALRLSGGLAYTWHAIETNRAVVLPGFADSLSANYDAGTFQAFGEAGYRIETGVASLEPFAGLAHVSLRTDGFAEEDGAAALSAASQTADTTFTTLGVNASRNFAIGSMNATAHGTLGWRHAFGDTTPLSTHAFAGGDAFTVAGAPIAEDAAIVKAGLDLAIADNATLGFSYEGQIASDAQDHGFDASLAVRF